MSHQDADLAVRAGINLSSVYQRLNDWKGAAQTLHELNPLIEKTTDPRIKATLYMHAASVAASEGDWAKADPYFHSGIDEALSQGDIAFAATAWNQLGIFRLRHGDLREAERALTEAFRLRKVTKGSNLGSSYAYLGLLRLNQHDVRSATNLLNQAIALAAKREAAIPASVLYYYRGRALALSGAIREAMADYEEGLQRAAEWRNEVLPSDRFRISAEVGLDRMYRDYVQTGMKLWAQTKDERIARRMFEVSEQHRSAAFRELLQTERELPPEYWEALSAYRRALTASVASNDNGAAESARLRLTRIEAQLGIPTVENGGVGVSAVQKRLGSTEALISVHTGEDESYLWSLTRESFTAQVLPSFKTLEGWAKQHRDAVEKGIQSDAGSDLGALFKSLGSVVRQKRDWLLSLDRGLYDAPFAAAGPADSPLALQHSLRVLPGAGLLNSNHAVINSADFVGAGDAIYNAADSRWKGIKKPSTQPLARLVNTRAEVLSASRAWTADAKPQLLFGSDLTRAALEAVSREDTAVLHIAAHVVRHAADPGQVMIALGLAPQGEMDFLTPADIAARPLRVGLVTVNGCASGTGASLPGVGLIGLTRSWLMAGAIAVAATYWPVNDDSGELFADMYGELSKSNDGRITSAAAARALQNAQLRMIRSGVPRNRWAAVFLTSKN